MQSFFSSIRVRSCSFVVGLSAVCGLANANTATAPHGMVAAVNPFATDAGVAAMKNGGNAIDAAIATALTLGVVDGQNSGIGGGCFMLIHLASGEFVCLDGREMAPAAATRDMYVRDGKGDTKLSQNGPLASGIPGSVAVYAYAAEHFGKKKFADLITPAAKIAEDGFPIDQKFADRLEKLAPIIKQYPDTAAILLKPDGSLYTKGDVLKQTDLAKTYRAMADGGADYYYHGPFAQTVGAWMHDHGGIITADDFANYKVKFREPIVSNYRGYTIVGFPPPSSGGLHVAQILDMVQNFDLEKYPRAQQVNIVVSAMELAFADRAYWLGDPDFVKVPRQLLSASYLKDRAKLITPDHALSGIDHGMPGEFNSDIFGKHTTDIATADADGNFVALTTTVNTSFGSKIIVPGTGVILNDQMDDFSIQPGVPNAFKLIGSEANAVGPGKRPCSSMSPTIVMKENQVVMSVGAAGGPTIITQVVLLLSNWIDLHQALGTAIASPRFHQQWSPPEISIEDTFAPDVLDSLKAMGWKLDVHKPVGATQAIIRNPDGTLTGASEPRVPGKAAGY